MGVETKTSLCVGIIMDGNRRWARENNLPKLEGHRRGYEKLKEVTEWAGKRDVGTLVVFALSTENWQRAQDEVSYLLELFRAMLAADVDELHNNNIRVSFVGDLSQFPDDIEQDMHSAMQLTKDNTGLHLALAVSYGGRAEIVHGVNVLLEKGKTHVTETEIEDTLWSRDIPDLDLIIRTGGEKRLSGFLTWRSVYSELFFPGTYWPAFTQAEFDAILDEYAERDRRFGK